jgi:pSer/pThr/pTyr-binding forkhead associated (FHA) protein
VGLALEIKAGPLAGRKIPLRSGETLLVGRASDRAQFAVPHDSHMSGLHFSVECGPSGCRLIDRNSTNGTFLNGAKIQEAMLASGDEIKSGQTVFVVRIVPDDQQLPATSAPSAQSPTAVQAERPALPPPADRPPRVSPAAPARAASVAPVSPTAPAARPTAAAQLARQPAPSAVTPARPSQTPALTIGSWSFAKIPDGWQIQEGLGIQLDTEDAFPSSIGAMEEPLGLGITLQQYVEAQTKMFREYLREPKIDAALPPAIPGASETVALEVRYSTKESQSIYYQRVYARNGSTVGVLTLTTLEKDLSSVRPAYASVLSAVSFADKEQSTRL